MPSEAQLGFSGSFLRGITNALGAKRQQAQEAAKRQQEQAILAYNVIGPKAENEADLNFLLPAMMPDLYGDGFKPKKGQPDPRQIISTVLGQALQAEKAQQTAPLTP